jgi:hypothetical protein
VRSLCDSPVTQSWGKRGEKLKDTEVPRAGKRAAEITAISALIELANLYTVSPLFLYGAMGSLLRVTELLGKLAGLGQRN